MALLTPADAVPFESLISEHCTLGKHGLIFAVGEETEEYTDKESKRTLTRAKTVPFEEWIQVGAQLKRVAGVAMYMLGDWLAYGQERYVDTVWKNRMPNGIYRTVSSETGFSESTLRTAKSVCARLPLCMRRDKLTFHHAQALVANIQNEAQFGYWIEQVEKNQWSVKEFWRRLRKAGSSQKEEPNDVGSTGLLEACRQFVRDFNSLVGKAAVDEQAEAKKILSPVVAHLWG